MEVVIGPSADRRRECPGTEGDESEYRNEKHQLETHDWFPLPCPHSNPDSLLGVIAHSGDGQPRSRRVNRCQVGAIPSARR